MKFQIPFSKIEPLSLGISILAVIASVVIILVRGFNYGIDFQGGAKLEYQFAETVNEEKIRQLLKPLKLGDVSVVRFGKAEDNRMRIKVELPEEHTAIGPMITTELEKSFGQGNVKLEQEETVGPRVGKELRKKAWLTILFSWLLMLIYIGYRFDFLFAPGGIIALIHDVVITLGFFSLLGKEINLTILAAILTLIGYSINDTIVIFDRIRENKHRISLSTLTAVVDESLNATLSRTIITSLTVFFVVVVLFLKGGGTLHDFAFALIIGVIVGSYSTLFVATPVYKALYRSQARSKK